MILRERVAKRRDLPGVPHGSEDTSWPRAGLPSSSANNGKDYLDYRHALRSRYACRWLNALHARDFDGYARLLYDVCASLALEVDGVPETGIIAFDNTERVRALQQFIQSLTVR